MKPWNAREEFPDEARDERRDREVYRDEPDVVAMDNTLAESGALVDCEWCGGTGTLQVFEVVDGVMLERGTTQCPGCKR